MIATSPDCRMSRGLVWPVCDLGFGRQDRTAGAPGPAARPLFVRLSSCRLQPWASHGLEKIQHARPRNLTGTRNTRRGSARRHRPAGDRPRRDPHAPPAPRAGARRPADVRRPPRPVDWIRAPAPPRGTARRKTALTTGADTQIVAALALAPTGYRGVRRGGTYRRN